MTAALGLTYRCTTMGRRASSRHREVEVDTIEVLDPAAFRLFERLVESVR
jgi:hypothetical protein